MGATVNLEKERVSKIELRHLDAIRLFTDLPHPLIPGTDACARFFSRSSVTFRSPAKYTNRSHDLTDKKTDSRLCRVPRPESSLRVRVPTECHRVRQQETSSGATRCLIGPWNN